MQRRLINYELFHSDETKNKSINNHKLFHGTRILDALTSRCRLSILKLFRDSGWKTDDGAQSLHDKLLGVLLVGTVNGYFA